MSRRSDSGYGSTLFGGMTRQSPLKDHYLQPQSRTNDHFNPTPSSDVNRNYAPSSASGLGSMADHFQSQLDLTPESAIDPNLDPNLDRCQVLAQVGVGHDVPLEQIHLQGDSIITPSNDFSIFPTPDRPFSFPQINGTVEDLWNSTGIMKRSPSYAQPRGAKRVRMTVDPSLNTQESNPSTQLSLSPGNQSHYSGTIQWSPQNSLRPPYSFNDPPNTEASPAFDTQPPSDVYDNDRGQQESLPGSHMASTAPERRPAKSKSARRPGRKYSCVICGPDKTFLTSNDLDRHMKTVHGQVPDGEKVWLCQVPGCISAAKVWVRLDNFKQHVSRMHGQDAAEDADKMCQDYSLARHGPVDTGKAKNRTRHNSVQQELAMDQLDMSSGALTGQVGFTFHAATSPQNSDSVSEARNQIYLNHPFPALGSSTNTPGSVTTSMINQAQRSSRTFSTSGIPPFGYGSPMPAEQTFVQRSTTQIYRPVPRTIANHEVAQYGRQYVQEENDANRNLQFINPAASDLALMGQGVQQMDQRRRSVDTAAPALVHAQSFAHAGGIDLESTAPDVPDDMASFLDRFRRNLPSEHRDDFSHICQMLRSASQGVQPAKSEVSARSVRETRTDRTRSKPHRCSKTVEDNGVSMRCDKSFEKKSELRKHENRHDRKYGCTFDQCYKMFGTKWEWKRHEHNQHIELEGWRCTKKDCQQYFDDKQLFITHVVQQHGIRGEEVRAELKSSQLEKKWLGSFWCGFCERRVESEKEFGSPMVEERNNHISNHIDGKNQKRSMWDWVELKGCGKTKRQMRNFREETARNDGSEVLPEVHGDTDSDDDVDAATEEDSPPQTTKPLSIDTQTARREPPGQRERRQSSARTPKIVISRHDDDDFGTSAERQSGSQRQRSLSNLGPQPYETQQRRVCCLCESILKQQSRCHDCAHVLCAGCKLEGPDQEIDRKNMEQMQQLHSGYGDDDEISMFLQEDFEA